MSDTLVCEKIIVTLESDPIKEQLLSEFQLKKKDP
jgi:hypothetical protein